MRLKAFFAAATTTGNLTTPTDYTKFTRPQQLKEPTKMTEPSNPAC